MLRHRLFAEEGNIACTLERDQTLAAERQLPRALQFREPRLDGGRIDGVGHLAEQAEDDTEVGRVAATGRAKRPVKVDADARHLRQQSALF